MFKAISSLFFNDKDGPSSSIPSSSSSSSSSSPSKDISHQLHSQSNPSRSIRPEEYAFKIAVLGSSHAGKTSLIRRLTKGLFTSRYIPTVGCDLETFLLPPNYSALFGMPIRVQFWDIPDQEFRGKNVPRLLEDAIAAIIVFDATSPVSVQAVDRWRLALAALPSTQEIPIALIATKSDKASLIIKESALESYARSAGFSFAKMTTTVTGQDAANSVLRFIDIVLHGIREKYKTLPPPKKLTHMTPSQSSSGPSIPKPSTPTLPPSSSSSSSSASSSSAGPASGLSEQLSSQRRQQNSASHLTPLYLGGIAACSSSSSSSSSSSFSAPSIPIEELSLQLESDFRQFYDSLLLALENQKNALSQFISLSSQNPSLSPSSSSSSSVSVQRYLSDLVSQCEEERSASFDEAIRLKALSAQAMRESKPVSSSSSAIDTPDSSPSPSHSSASSSPSVSVPISSATPSASAASSSSSRSNNFRLLANMGFSRAAVAESSGLPPQQSSLQRPPSPATPAPLSEDSLPPLSPQYVAHRQKALQGCEVERGLLKARAQFSSNSIQWINNWQILQDSLILNLSSSSASSSSSAFGGLIPTSKSQSQRQYPIVFSPVMAQSGLYPWSNSNGSNGSSLSPENVGMGSPGGVFLLNALSSNQQTPSSVLAAVSSASSASYSYSSAGNSSPRGGASSLPLSTIRSLRVISSSSAS